MRIAALTLVSVSALCWGEQPLRQAVALIETGGAKLIRSGDGSELQAPPGELLADGDTLIAASGAVTYVLCGSDQRGVRRTLGSGRTEIRAPGATPAEQSFSCALPQLDPNPAIGSLDDKDVDNDETARSGTTGSLIERVTRAVQSEKAGNYTEAAREYAGVAQMWPEEKWARRLTLQIRAKQQQPSGSGKTYALLIGISQYANSAVPPLKYADADARLFHEFLEKTARAKQISAEWVVLPLINPDANYAKIRVELTEFLGRAGKSDSILLYIAAHGITPKPGDGDPNDGYIVLNNSDPQYLATTGISMKYLRDVLATYVSRVNRVFLFVDTCHADRIGQIRGGRIDSDTRISAALRPLKENHIFTFLATESGKVSYEHERYGGGHGAFTYFLLRALNISKNDSDYREADLDGNGYIDIDELVEYVRDNVKRATNRQQIPTYDKLMDDFRVRVDAAGLSLKPYIRSGSLAGAINRDPETAAATARSVPWGDPATIEKRVALEEEGQKLIEKYLRGEESPQTAADFSRGVQVYETALALAGPSMLLEARLEFFRGRLLIFRRQYAEAADRLERSIRLEPGGAYAYNALGIAYLEQAQYNRAEAAFDDAIDRAPHWAYPRHNLALTFMQRGDYAASIETYKRAMSLAPEYAYLPYNLGLVYQKINREDEAIAEFRRSLEKRSWHAGPAIALGLVNMNHRRFAKAQEFFDDARTRLGKYSDPNFLLALRHNEGLLRARRGDISGARSLWLENINTAMYLPSRFALARALVEEAARHKKARDEYYAEAVTQYQCILSEAPSNVGARLEFASLLERIGQADVAQSVIAEGLREYPAHTELQARMRALSRRNHR